MKLSQLGLFNKKDQIAWVGAGGKTSLIFAVAKELFMDRCVVTTTTKMALSEKLLADHVIETEKIDKIDFSEISGINFVYSEQVTNETAKVKGFDEIQLQHISSKLLEKNIPLLIEADGSNRKPLKFPAEHEPVIPKFVNKVCLVVGLSAIGKQLNKENFHRPELISKVLSIPLGTKITWDHLYEILSNEKGWKKNFPHNAETVVFLHQAETLNKFDDVNEIALKLIKDYDHVLLSSIDQNELSIKAHWGQMGCAILAAGASVRFGSPKQLAQYKKKTFVENVIETAKEINFSDIVVVLGANFDRIKNSIDSLNVNIIHNKSWEEGQSTSVKESVKFFSQKKVEAIIFLMVDQPQISSHLIENIIHKYAYHKSDVIVHEFENQNRHPILFAKSTFTDLSQIYGERGGSQLFAKYPPEKISITDPYFAHDIDRVDDLKKLNKKD
jgi:molybdenum cofactor cytidylyltransferase